MCEYLKTCCLENLAEAEALLKDDQLYLKDLTERCEQRVGALTDHVSQGMLPVALERHIF